ncbi:MAG: hypothetical protein ACK44N_05065 [Bacteroidota bacterium]|jgi:hypothetical protein
MKKLILLAAITFILGGIVNAQTSENVVKGIHGGVVFGSEDLKFEFVEKGSDVLVYPVSPDGKMLSAVPTHATINIVPMAVQLRQEFTNVELKNGCFKVTREDAQLPLYILGISTSLNEKRYDAKYVVPNVQAR